MQVHVKSIEDFAQLGCFDENQDKQQPTKASSTQQQTQQEEVRNNVIPVLVTTAAAGKGDDLNLIKRGGFKVEGCFCHVEDSRNLP